MDPRVGSWSPQDPEGCQMMSETERRQLEDIARHVELEDPELAMHLSTGSMTTRRLRSGAALSVILIVLGMVGVLGLLSVSVALSFLCLLVVAAGAFLACHEAQARWEVACARRRSSSPA